MRILAHILAGAALAATLVLPAVAQDKGTVGISMPTKSSARWIADGDNMVKQFTEAGYDTDLQYADDDIPNQLAQIENMITKGVKVLVIAAIDGTTLSNALQNAAAAGIQVIAYDRLIRDSDERRLLRHLRQLPGRRAAGELARRRASRSASRTARARSTSSCSAARPTTTTPSSSTTARCRCCSPTSTAASSSSQSGQMGMDKVGTLRWDGAVAQARMDNLLSANYTDDQRRRRAVALRRPVDRHPVVAEGRRLRHGRQPMPIVTGQDAEVPSVKSILARRAVLDRLQGHPRARQGHRRHGRRAARRRRRRRSTTPRPTTTASRSCRPTC